MKATVPVELTVSGTQTSVSVPSVLGQSPASAGSALTQARAERREPEQCVLEPVPAAGAGVVAEPGRRRHCPAQHAGQPRRLERPLHLGPQTWSASRPSAAQSAITGAGLVANQTTDTACPNGATPGNVDAQSPAAGAQVPTAPRSTSRSASRRRPRRPRRHDVVDHDNVEHVHDLARRAAAGRGG